MEGWILVPGRFGGRGRPGHEGCRAVAAAAEVRPYRKKSPVTDRLIAACEQMLFRHRRLFPWYSAG